MRFNDFCPPLTQLQIDLKRDAAESGRPVKIPGLEELLVSALSSGMLDREHGVFDGAVEGARLVAEFIWRALGRPYYNVWPIAVDLCLKTKLDIPLSDLPLNYSPLLVRFPVGHEPHGISWILFHIQDPVKDRGGLSAPELVQKENENPSVYMTTPNDAGGRGFDKKVFIPTDFNLNLSASATIGCYLLGRQPLNALFGMAKSPGRVFVNTFTEAALEKHTLESIVEESPESKETAVLAKTYAFLSLLSQGHDLITPALLKADEGRYRETDDEILKRKLEDRAKRQLGLAFDVGKALQEEYDQAVREGGDRAPHFRRRHLRLAHTGQGRKERSLVWVKEAKIGFASKEFTEVPTGFLGQETEEERKTQLEPPKPRYRPPIPPRIRFMILERDGDKCVKCGRTAKDGVILEVDHIHPHSKGGSSNPHNLQTLCDICNGGKSDLTKKTD